MNKLHFFIKDNGKLFVFKGDLPEEPKFTAWQYMSPATSKDCYKKYQEYAEALQRAKEDAIEVDNQRFVRACIIEDINDRVNRRADNLFTNSSFQIGNTYSLEGCEMTLKNYCTNKHTISGCTNETCWDLEECQAKVSLALITFSEKKEDKPTPEKKEEETQAIRLRDMAITYDLFLMIKNNTVNNGKIIADRMMRLKESIQADFFHSKETNQKIAEKNAVDLTTRLLKSGYEITLLDGDWSVLQSISPPLYDKYIIRKQSLGENGNIQQA